MSDRVRLERTFQASAQEVFDAWTSVEVVKRWWHAEHDWETPHAEVDLRLGGAIRLIMRNPKDGAEYGGRGEFVTIDVARRLVFTWGWDYEEDSKRQLIEVDFIERGDRTTVVLTHSGLPAAETDEYVDGWQKSFDNLEVALGS
jgi:uncharacterized protein YndB with AHSA1/START domain